MNRSNRYIIISTIIYLLTGSLSAGDEDRILEQDPGKPSRSALLDHREFMIGYFGELITHPGVSFSINSPGHPEKWIALAHRSVLSVYLHRMNHSAILLSQHIGPRFYSSRRNYSDVMFGIGYMHTRLTGEVYVSDPDGGVNQEFDIGRPHLMASLSLGFGWPGSQMGPHELRLIVFGQYPVNGIMVPHLALEISRRLGKK